MSQVSVLRGGGGGSFVLCSCKIPIGRNLEYFLLLGCSVTETCHFLTDKKLCDRTDLHQNAFSVTVITLVAIIGVVCMFISQRYTQVIFELRSKSWKRTYAHFEIMLVVNVEQIQGTRQTNVKLSSCNRA